MGALRNPEDERVRSFMGPDTMSFGGGVKEVIGYHAVREDAPKRVIGDVRALDDVDVHEKHANPVVDIIDDRAVLSPARQGWIAAGRKPGQGNLLAVREAVLRHMLGEGEERLLRLRNEGVDIVKYVDENGLFTEVDGPAGELLTTRWTDFKKALIDNGAHIEDDGETFLRKYAIGLHRNPPLRSGQRIHGFFEMSVPESQSCKFGGHILTVGELPLENARSLTITDPKDEQMIMERLREKGLQNIQLHIQGR